MSGEQAARFTLLACDECGWHSEEINREQLRDRGIPWYCDNCGKQGLRFVHYTAQERQEAQSLMAAPARKLPEIM